MLNQILEAQMTEHLGAEPYERTAERNAYRNGFRSRTLNSRVGKLVLNIPQSRDGKFSTELFARYQRSEQSFMLALMEMVVQGVSTRKVTLITEKLCGTSFSKTTVSELCKELDVKVNAWNERPLTNSAYPFMIIDALVIKIRKDGVVKPASALIATGINEFGFREILGVKIGNSESYETWSEMFTWLKSRGLSSIDFIVSDNHKGLVKAISKHFQNTIWQRCQAHFIRNILSHTPSKHKKHMIIKIKEILNASDKKTARKFAAELFNELEGKADKALSCLENGLEDAIAVLDLPEKYRKRLKSTNMLERLNEEIRRRERVIRIFPNEESPLRLIGALLLEKDEVWSLEIKYLIMDDFFAWKNRFEKNEELSLIK